MTAGYSPAIGFIHTGKALSFVYNIADFYKASLIVPIVFELVAESDRQGEQRSRYACRDLFGSSRLLARILPDIQEVLDGCAHSGKSSPRPAGRSESLDDRTENRDIPWSFDSAFEG